MGLRSIAEADLATTLEDVAGFGWPITITDPSGVSASITGQSDDIALEIDPETGQLVSGRVASVALRISTLTANGLGLPVGVANESLRPWVVKFKDPSGNDYTFKVQQSNPDRALGVVTCRLETYQE